MFSSRNFIVSVFTFRCLIHFEFIFLYGVRECSNFILLHVAVQFFWEPAFESVHDTYSEHAEKSGEATYHTV